MLKISPELQDVGFLRNKDEQVTETVNRNLRVQLEPIFRFSYP